MLSVLVLLLFIAFLCLCFKKTIWGVAMFTAIIICIPITARVFGIGLQSLCTLLLFLWVIKDVLFNHRLYNKKYNFPILGFIIPLMVIGLFGVIDYQFQMKQMLYLLPSLIVFITYLYSVKTENDIDLISKTFIYSFFIIGIYGIITYIIKMNPYALAFATTFGVEDADYLEMLKSTTDNVRGGLVGRATGSAISSLIWGQVCLVALPIIMFLHPKDMNQRFIYANIFISSLNIFLSGHRSCILPMFLLIVYYFYRQTSRRQFIQNAVKILVALPIIYVVLSMIPETKGYVQNIETTIFFWDDTLADKHNIGGSSNEMRLNQLIGAFDMVKDHFLCGLGYGYPTYYAEKYGQHPIMLGFESIFFREFVSSGFLGFLVWLLFFKKCYTSTIYNKQYFISLMIHGSYFISILLTGIQSTFGLYLIMTAIMMKKIELNQTR